MLCCSIVCHCLGRCDYGLASAAGEGSRGRASAQPRKTRHENQQALLVSSSCCAICSSCSASTWHAFEELMRLSSTAVQDMLCATFDIFTDMLKGYLKTWTLVQGAKKPTDLGSELLFVHLGLLETGPPRLRNLRDSEHKPPRNDFTPCSEQPSFASVSLPVRARIRPHQYSPWADKYLGLAAQRSPLQEKTLKGFTSCPGGGCADLTVLRAECLFLAIIRCETACVF